MLPHTRNQTEKSFIEDNINNGMINFFKLAKDMVLGGK